MKALTKTIVLFVLLAVFSNANFAQVVGKIFTREEADKLFGPVLNSAKISPNDLNASVSKTQSFVMFRTFGNEPVVLGDGRKALYPSTDALVGSTDIYHVYSKSVVVELLSKSKGDVVYLENRKNVFSVTFGAYTMEMGIICPPICY